LRVFLFCLIFFYCSKPTEEDKNNNLKNEINLTQSITTSTMWTKDNIYIIEGTIGISNAILTIQPGTIIKFKEGASIVVETGGGIMAQGTVDNPIVFTATQPQTGWWDYIWFSSDALFSQCVLNHCTIEYGGGYGTEYGMIYCDDASPTITNCLIKHSQSYGVCLAGNSKPVFKNNLLSNNNIPLQVNFANAYVIDSCDFQNNTQQYIEVNQATLTSNATWQKQAIPYLVKGGAIQNAVLTLLPGITLWLESGAELTVNSGGGLIAEGTPTELITITGRNKQSGYWDYIWFTDNAIDAQCRFKYCTIEYGGGYSSDYGMIQCESASPTIINCTLRYSEAYGVCFTENSQPIFRDNIVTNNNIPIQVNFANAGFIKEGNYTGNTHDYIEVNSATLSQNTTWVKQDIPYLIEDGTIQNATLTIMAGATIWLATDAELVIDAGGALIADGTNEQITFTAQFKQKGAWDYIWFSSNCQANECKLINCLIEYGGGYSSDYAMIYCEDVAPLINNCYIQNSATWGIYYPLNPQLVENNNNFSNNTSGDIQPQD